MKSFKFLALVFLHLSLRGTDAAPTTTPAPNNQYSWEWNELEDYYKGDELEVEYEQPTQPPYPTTHQTSLPSYCASTHQTSLPSYCASTHQTRRRPTGHRSTATRRTE